MADVKISALTQLTVLDGTEDLPIVDAGVTRRCSTQAIADLAIINEVITVTSAEILALFTTPKILVPAPGANHFVRVIAITEKVVFNSAAYSVTTSKIKYDGGAGGHSFMSNIAVAQTDNQIYNLLPSTSSQFASSDVLNKAVVIQADASNPTGGNSSLKIFISYQILDLS